jgi:SAM-dependent methyltransferase
MVNRIVAASPGRDVLDIGIGTGIQARQFRAADCTVFGVDPDPRMAAFAQHSGFEVDVSTVETWDPGQRTFDVVIAGQAWHWVDPVVGAVKAAQVLRPGGRLAVFWNAAQPPPDIGEAFADVYERVIPDAPSARAYRQKMPALEMYSAMATMAGDGMRRASAFDEPERWLFEWQQIYRREQWLDQLPTLGDHSQFPPDKLAEVMAGVGAAIDTMGGAFTMRYTTVVVTATRAPGETAPATEEEAPTQ